MTKYLPKTNLTNLLDSLKKDYEVFVPIKKGEQRFYRKYTEPTTDIVIGEVRAFEPLKSFYLKARGLVAENFSDALPHADDKPYAVVGVKACDLKGFKVQDHVFLKDGCLDPFYEKLRKDNLIISADCTSTIETCFCLAMNIKPYPEEDFDINLTDVGDGFVVRAGSDKGKKILENNVGFLQDVTGNAADEMNQLRSRITKEIESNISKNSVPHQDKLEGKVKEKYDSALWEEEAKECVECGACNTICPTCHCFYLADQKDKAKMERFRLWDSCLQKNFARVAGGANDRPKLAMRLRNRFDKKFSYFPEVAGFYACTGCGRCISACPAKIDIRKIIKKLAS